jgi:hypothetical protein
MPDPAGSSANLAWHRATALIDNLEEIVGLFGPSSLAKRLL